MTRIEFNVKTGKYVGYMGTKVVVKSSSEYYVKRQLQGMNTSYSTAPAAKVSEFGINQRFGFVEQMVDMITDRTLPSAVITGEGWV